MSGFKFKELFFAILSILYGVMSLSKLNRANTIPNEFVLSVLFLILAEIYSFHQK